ncbi:MAG: hypothetical protein U0835_19975 [Isosphaeraceae bacterium]
MKFPIDTLSVNSRFRSLGGTNTSVGNLSLFGKYVLWWNEDKSSLISTGMMVTVPTGPTNFAGSPAAIGFRSTALQPFLAFLWSQGRFYAQGFTAIDVATNSRDVTLYYNDLGLGYFVYRNEEPTAFIRALAPTFELHVNTPLNHRGALRLGDPAGSADVVDLTYGLNTYFSDRAILSLGVATPVTGPRPFAYEVLALLNVYYGRTRAARNLAMTPPSL